MLEHGGESVSQNGPSLSVSLYGRFDDGTVALWRIPNRSHGLLLGHTKSIAMHLDADRRLYDIYEELDDTCLFGRGVPPGVWGLSIPSYARTFKDDWEGEPVPLSCFIKKIE